LSWPDRNVFLKILLNPDLSMPENFSASVKVFLLVVAIKKNIPHTNIFKPALNSDTRKKPTLELIKIQVHISLLLADV